MERDIDPDVISTLSEWSVNSALNQPCSDVELEVVKDVDFAQGFDSWRFKTRMDDVFATDDKSVLEFKTATTVPGNVARKSEYTWRVRCDTSAVALADTYWIGLEHVQRLERPMPILYRMAIFDEATDHVRCHWGELAIIRPSPKQIIWHSISDDHPDQLAVFKEGSKGLCLHIFLSIPRSYVMGPAAPDVDPIKPKFELDEDADELTLKFAKTFDMVVLGSEDTEENEDEDVFANEANHDLAVEHFGIPSDYAIKVIDRKDGSKREFSCHRIILTIRSVFFAALLRRRRRSTRSSVTEDNIDRGEIEIVDVDAETMECVLRYLYTGCLPKLSKRDGAEGDLDTVLKMTQAGKKFGLDQWNQYCLSVLIFEFVDDESRAKQKPIAQELSLRPLDVIIEEQLAICAYAMAAAGPEQRVKVPPVFMEMALRKFWSFRSGDVHIHHPQTDRSPLTNN